MINILQNCTSPTLLKNGKIVNCGTCPICQARKSLEWNVRANHELLDSKGAIFITLTYDNQNLPREGWKGKKIISSGLKGDRKGNLCKEDIIKFNKRLRKHINKKLDGRKIKTIYCGEYGPKTMRPHYHEVIFNISPSEITEEEIYSLWQKGRIDLSKIQATDHAVQYVTGYVRKKILDKQAKYDNYYSKGRIPPFLGYSQGIGKNWALRNIDKWTKTLEIAYNECNVTVPRYYIKLAKKLEGKTYYYDQYTVNKDEEGKNYTIDIERRYKTIENVEGKYTYQINYMLFQKKYSQLEAIKEDKSILKRDDYFEIVSETEKQIDIDWQMYYNKVCEYTKYYNNPTRFYLDKWKKNKRNEQQALKAQPKKDSPPREKQKIEFSFTEEMLHIAKMKEYRLINGAYGQRIKDNQ